MAKEYKEILARAIKRFFIQRNTLPSFLHFVEHSFEALLYLIIIHSPNSISQLIPLNNSTAVLLIAILIALLLLRTFKQISFIKIFYPFVLTLALHQSSEVNASLSIILLFLTGFLIALDLFSNIALNFNPNSLTSETLNFTKFVHAFLFVLGIIQSKIWQNSLSFLVCGLAFGLLGLMKGASIMRNDNFKEFLMRVYLLLSMANMSLSLHLLIALPGIVRFALPLLLSQFIFQMYYILRKRIKLQQLFSQQKYFQLSFQVCKYICGGNYSRRFEEEIESLIGRGSLLEFMPTAEKLHLIYQKIIQLLLRSKQFQSQLLLTEMHIINSHRLLKARYLIERLRSKAGFNLIQQILIYRQEQILNQAFRTQSNKINFDNEESYHKCDQFRSLLLKAASHHINFWEYSLKKQIQIQRFREMADKILDFQDRIRALYGQIEVKCITITLLYVSYLFRVAREITTGKKILEEVSFNEENEVNFQLNQRVFIQIDLENPFKILKIGHNVSLLLGFERKEIEGQQTQMFLPDFYKKFHREAIQMKTIEDNLSSLHLLNKKVIIKNKWNYYRECNLIMRLHYNIGQGITIQGFLHIKDNPQYSWFDYLFIDENEEIIECSDSFGEFMPTNSRKHKASEVFSQHYNEKKSNFFQNNQYYPLLVFNLDTKAVSYFVRREPRSIDQLEMANQNLMELSKEVNAKYFALQSVFWRKYLQQMNSCLRAIFSKQFLVLVVLSVVLLGSIFTMQLLFYTTMNRKQNSQNLMINKTSDIIQYANNYTEISILMNYLDLNRQNNYNNDFTNTNKIVEDALALQAINQRLKYLSSTQKFPIPSAEHPDITYSMSPFQITLEYLANAYMVEKFKHDSFMEHRLFSQFRKTAIDRAKYTYLKIRSNYLNEINAQPQQTLTNNIVLIVLIIISLIILFLLILRSQTQIRVNQQQSLTLVANVKYQEELIVSSKGFVANITRQELKTIKNQLFLDTGSKVRKNQQTSFAPDLTANERENMKSEVSMRELSNRNLMEETVNKSLFLTSRGGEVRQSGVREGFGSGHLRDVKEMRILGRKKRYVWVPVLLVGLIGGILILNLVQNGIVNTIDEKQSAQNIFNFFVQTINLSRRINNFLNYLNLKIAGVEVNSSQYSVLPTDFQRIQTIVDFDQTKLSEFATFEDSLINLQYRYLCNFVNCDPRFRDEINIIYTSTIEKVFKSINSIIQTLEPLNSTAVGIQLSTSTIKYNIDLIFYTQMVIRTCVTNLLDKYNDCYLRYSQNLLQAKQIEIAIAISFTAIATILYILFVVVIRQNQLSLERIVDILNVKDYSDQMLEEQSYHLEEPGQ